MEINLGNNFAGSIGVRAETADTHVEKTEKSGASRVSLHAAGITIENRLEALAAAEPTVDVPESELRRDDALGNLVNAAFGLKAPPPPEFERSLA